MDGFGTLTERQDQALTTFFGFIQLATALASPRWLARCTEDDQRQMTKERILGLVDDFLRVSGCDPGKPAESSAEIEEPALRMRALLASWEFGPAAPAPLIQAARDFLNRVGTSYPDEYWDQFEGPPADEIPSEGTDASPSKEDKSPLGPKGGI